MTLKNVRKKCIHFIYTLIREYPLTISCNCLRVKFCILCIINYILHSKIKVGNHVELYNFQNENLFEQMFKFYVPMHKHQFEDGSNLRRRNWHWFSLLSFLWPIYSLSYLKSPFPPKMQAMMSLNCFPLTWKFIKKLEEKNCAPCTAAPALSWWQVRKYFELSVCYLLFKALKNSLLLQSILSSLICNGIVHLWNWWINIWGSFCVDPPANLQWVLCALNGQSGVEI